MSLPVNPFDLANELIRKNYRIAIPIESHLLCKNVNSNFISTLDNNTVHLGDLLNFFIAYILKLTHENDELKNDLKCIENNGSVNWFCDEYYSNLEGFDEANIIFKKWNDRIKNEHTIRK